MQRYTHNRREITLIFALIWLLAACGNTSTSGGTTTPVAGAPGSGDGTGGLPQFAHIVVVIEENHSASAIYGNGDAPYINQLAGQGATFTDAHGVAHPSEPNYLALFAGTTFGLTSDACPQHYSGANLASGLNAVGKSFIGYSENLPSMGFTGCSAGGNFFVADYARKHNPWVDFAALPASINQPFSQFPSDFTRLPAVAYVIPNQQNDMHSGSVATGDQWLRTHLDAYARWAAQHDSLLLITWDEDDGSAANQIPTIVVGAHIRPGQYGELVTHYTVLRTIEALMGVLPSGSAASVQPISDIWQ